MLPVPMVAASAVHRQAKGGDVAGAPMGGAGLLGEGALDGVAQVAPGQELGAHGEENAGAHQDDQHDRAPDPAVNGFENV